MVAQAKIGQNANILQIYTTRMGEAGIVGTRWNLISIVLEGVTIDGVVDAGADLTLGADGRVVGRGGCNRYFGKYTLEGENISFGPLASTLMYCEDTMAMENAFFKALDAVRTVHWEDNALQMLSGDGSTVLDFSKGVDE
jgi:heat shock protein HslJ